MHTQNPPLFCIIMYKNLQIIFFVAFFLAQIFFTQKIFAQVEDTTKIDDLLKFKVTDMTNQTDEDLLNIQVSLASKKLESLFDAPVATSVLTKEEIKRSGATSIPEALRLIPGMMIAEQTNGNYDVHVRGGSNIQRNSLYSISANTKTLVMIDNRPVYNYYLGGTFWENMPIDLGDIERIEVVRGATSAMYGPNAVSGVINIITKKLEETGGHTIVNVQQGGNNSYINNASIGYKFNRKLSLIVSGNSQIRDRNQNTYYSFNQNQYLPYEEIILRRVQSGDSALVGAFPRVDIAMIKYGVNAFLDWKYDEKNSVAVSAGFQNSQVQKVYGENFEIPLSTSLTNSRYWDIRAKFGRFTLQNSQQMGTQDEGLGSLGQKWDFRTSDLLLEYDFKKIAGINFKASFNSRDAIYDDTPYVNVAIKQGQFNGRKELQTQSLSLRGDYSFWDEKIRLSGAIRADKFNFPNDIYLSWLVSVNYKKNERNNYRFTYQRAFRSPNIIFTYADRYLKNLLGNNTALAVQGNQNVKLMESNVFEFGYRVRLGTNLLLDAEVFGDFTKNYSNFLYTSPYTTVENGNTINTQPFKTENIPLQARQFGTTISLFYSIKKLQIRPYITFQNTTLINSTSYSNTADAFFAGSNTNPTIHNINSGLGKQEKHTGSPDVFGGMYANFQYEKFNFNFNCYFFSNSTYYSFQDRAFEDGRGIDNINGKFIANLKIIYAPITSTSIFLNIRNVLDQSQREFFKADNTGQIFYGGLHFEF